MTAERMPFITKYVPKYSRCILVACLSVILMWGLPAAKTVRVSTGLRTLVIDAGAWSLMSTDPGLEINAANCVGYSGRVKVSFPAVGSTPADDMVIFLLFLVRSDGVVVL